MSQTTKITAVVPSGGATSGEINFSKSIPRAVIIPATMTSATFTFTNAPITGETQVAVRNATLAASPTTTTSYTVTITGNTGVQIPLDTNVAEGLAFAKIVTASNEAADRTFIFICREGVSAR